MYQLVYVSTATSLLSVEELELLLTKARRFNAAAGITGLLLYCEGNVMQALEGEREPVSKLMARIRRDRRHKDIRMLFDADGEERNFADWSMQFRQLSGSENRRLQAALEAPGGRFGQSIPKLLLRAYYDTNCLGFPL
ncbi:MAG: BLUF domain-containing protein [Dongiaceae bacterium]